MEKTKTFDFLPKTIASNLSDDYFQFTNQHQMYNHKIKQDPLGKTILIDPKIAKENGRFSELSRFRNNGS